MSPETGTGKYERFLERCRTVPAVPTAVAFPCEESALVGAVEAGALGLTEPILVGPARSRIASCAVAVTETCSKQTLTIIING